MDLKSIPIKTALAVMAAVLAWRPDTVLAEALLPGSEAPDLWAAGLKMAATLAILIGGLLLALYLVRRLSASKSGLFGGQELIRVIGTRSLAPKKYIALIEVGGSVLTLGVTNESISCLDKVEAEAFRAGLGNPAGQVTETSFARRLKDLTLRGPAAPKGEKP